MRKSKNPKTLADLNEIALFAAVAGARSFSGAAKRLGVPVSTVSRKVSQLEARLGVALLVRTTRQVRTTEAGAQYLEDCERLIAGFEAAEESVSETSMIPKGRLRVTAPTDFGANRHFADLLKRFVDRYPEVAIELVLENRRVDLVAEQVDVAIRAGKLGDSSLIAKRLGKTRMQIMASAAFLERFGPIKSVDDLSKLPCIRMSTHADHSQWILQSATSRRTMRVSGPISANSMGAMTQLAAAGIGLAVLPNYRSDALIERLIVVLPEWSAGDAPVHIVYPARRLVPARLTAFVNFFVGEVEAGRLPPFFEAQPPSPKR